MEVGTCSSKPISAKLKRQMELRRPHYVTERRFVKQNGRWYFIGWASEIDFLYARDEGIAFANAHQSPLPTVSPTL